VPRWQQRFLAACGGIVGYCLAYVLCDFGKWPRLAYSPLDHAWRMTSSPAPLEMSYLGMVLWGLGGALVGAGIVSVAARLVGRELSASVDRLAGAWALTAVGFAGLYFTWALWPF